MINKTQIFVLLLALPFTLSVKAAELEIISGDQRMFVNGTGEMLREIPEVITPEGFSPILQPSAEVSSNKVAESYRALHKYKTDLFEDLKAPQNSDLTQTILGCLHKPQVSSSIKQLHPGNKRVQIAEERLSYYRSVFETIFESENVPAELIGLGFVESTYDSRALSHAGARGVWQFIPSTGKHFGLLTAADYADPIKSTTAAAKYLNRLHARFGDWLLAIAAYNAGETRVGYAIKQAGTKNFWQVSPYLPTETQNYVPRVIAASSYFGGYIEKKKPVTLSQ